MMNISVLNNFKIRSSEFRCYGHLSFKNQEYYRNDHILFFRDPSMRFQTFLCQTLPISCNYCKNTNQKDIRNKTFLENIYYFTIHSGDFILLMTSKTDDERFFTPNEFNKRLISVSHRAEVFFSEVIQLIQEKLYSRMVFF